MMKRALFALLTILAAAPSFGQGDFVVNYRGLIAGRTGVSNGFVDFYRTDTAYRVRLQGPTGLAASRTFTLPATLGSSGQALTTDGAGAMSWASLLAASDIGSTVQAYHANLGAIAGLTYGANLCTYWTGAGVAATMSCTAAGRSMIGAADAAAQTALLSSFTGDSGFGGLKGLVPAPSSGDGSKYLKGDGSWGTVSSGITHNSTATSGCTDGGLFRSTSNLADCGAGLTYGSDMLKSGSTTNQKAAIGSIAFPAWGLWLGSGAEAPNIANYSIVQATAAPGELLINDTTAVTLRTSNADRLRAISTGVSVTGTFSATGATTIGGSGITGTTVPLTVSRGSSSGNIANFQTTAGNTVSYFDNVGNLLVGSGTLAAPAVAFAAATDEGWYRGSGGGWVYVRLSTPVVSLFPSSTSPSALLTANIASGSTAAFGINQNVFITSKAAATVQLGLDVNGAAVNQTFKAHDGITGTNISGADMTIAAGRGTGTGAGGTLAFQTAPVEASGTTAQTLTTRMTIQKDGGITFAGVVFANLGTPADGTLFFCSDCTIASPCAGGGTGALAKRLNATWVCN